MIYHGLLIIEVRCLRIKMFVNYQSSLFSYKKILRAFALQCEPLLTHPEGKAEADVEVEPVAAADVQPVTAKVPEGVQTQNSLNRFFWYFKTPDIYSSWIILFRRYCF